MAEENWAAHGGVQACDLCHARKVKCDRKEPCSNCVTTKAECLRNRHKRTPRPKVKTDEKIKALVQRLSTLENSVRHAPLPEVINSSATPEASISPDRPLKRKRTESSLNGALPTPTPDLDTTQQPANEARILISRELSTNGLLSVHQRSVLENAISFVDRLSHAPAPTITDRSTFNKSMYGSTDLTHGEILHVILGTKARSIDSPTLDIHSVDPVPPKSVEKIGLLLMDGTADEKTLNLCKVIIHFKAAAVLYASHLQGPKTPDVQKHIRQMEYHHMTAALTAMDGISFLTPPSILLVQALIIGSMMMQIIGNPASCWELIAHASRTIVALGYHTISDINPKNDLDEEIHAVVAWCSQIDCCMSLLLLRPRSLPPLQVKESMLLECNPVNPLSIFEIIAMEMIPVQDKILELTLRANAKTSVAVKNDEVAWLRQTLSGILEYTEKNRPSHLLDDENHKAILLHWKCLEFRYYSTLASVHRLSSTVTTNPSEREECLQSARRALECVKFIEDVGKSLGHFIEGYDPYLAWTMLSYPLCPFFVVFCNVVGTSNAADYQLLQDVTDGISALVSENKFVNRLHRLCTTLLGLCKPLVRNSAPPPHAYTAAQVSEFAAMPAGAGSEHVNATGDVEGFMASSWDDDMMWQLFQSQPSLDWFNADIPDPMLDFGLPN